MSLYRVTVVIDFRDGTQERIENITRTKEADGVLHLFRRWSFEHDEEHMGSWPMDQIRKYQRFY